MNNIKEKQKRRLIRIIIILSAILLLGLFLCISRIIYLDLKIFGINDPVNPEDKIYKIEYYIDDVLYETLESQGGVVEELSYQGDFVFSGWYLDNEYYDKYDFSQKTTTDLQLFATYFTYEEMFALLCDNYDKKYQITNTLMEIKPIDNVMCIEYYNNVSVLGMKQSSIFRCEILNNSLTLNYYHDDIYRIETNATFKITYDNNLNNISNIKIELVEKDNTTSDEILYSVASAVTQEIYYQLKQMINNFETDAAQLIRLGRRLVIE